MIGRRITILILLIGVLLALLGAGVAILMREEGEVPPLPEAPPSVEIPKEESPPPSSVRTVGTSVEERPIELSTFGTGSTSVLIVGGIHGGYEWNSALLAYELIAYFTEDVSRVPEGMRVDIIPVLNPDGLTRVVGTSSVFTEADVPPVDLSTGLGRMNARGVDLNRNFDCKWQSESTWRNTRVSAGTAPFSEPEAVALRDVVTTSRPSAVIMLHSKANAVYASECTEGILPATRVLMETYASASGYTPIDVFDAYPVTGDAEGWLASIGIPAITVELETRTSSEWARNLPAFRAVLTELAR